MSKLAIVIPAYKSMFFDQALLSIANQTNKDFTLYVGDDNSPDSLYSNIQKYENRIPIVYKHFDENLGGKDLVAQWERCIDMVGDEEWIWLFSDDDTMDTTCVENFYKLMYQFPNYDMFHFNVLHIDETNQIVEDFSGFPDVLKVEELLERRLKGRINSSVVEYVFRKSHFIDNGRFQKFDLAWGSDDATWIKLGKIKGIKNINDSMVFWRKSAFNISPNYWDRDIIKRKLLAQIEFASWIYNQTKQNEIQIEILHLKKLLKSWFFKSIKYQINLLSFELIACLVSTFYWILDKRNNPKLKIISLYIFKAYRLSLGKMGIILFWNFLKTFKPV